MIFERPLLLLAFLALPAIYLLARSRARRRPVPVSSLLIWNRLGLATDPPRELARRTDRLLLLFLSVAALAALGLSGPVFAPGAPAPVVTVLIDNSPSMEACADGVARALEVINVQAPAGADLSVTRGLVGDSLPALLGRPGSGDVVVITDQPLPGLTGEGRVRPFLVGEPVSNVGITAAWLIDGHFGAEVTSFAAASRETSVTYPGGEATFTLLPGESRVVRGEAADGRALIVLSPGDAYRFDDRVLLVAIPARTVALAWRGPREPSLALALRAAGVVIDPAAAAELCYRSAPGAGARLIVAPPGEKRAVDDETVVAGPGLPGEASPPPGMALGPATILDPAGVMLLADRDGPLAQVDGERIVLALDPGDPASQWTRHPSFPIFIREAAGLLGVRAAGFEVARGVVDPAESATTPVASAPRLSGLRPGNGPEPDSGTRPAALLFGLAALLLLVHTLLEAAKRQ